MKAGKNGGDTEGKRERTPTVNKGKVVENKDVTKKRPERPAGAVIDSSKMPYWDETQGVLRRLESSFGARVLSLYVVSDSSLTEGDVPEVYHHLQNMGYQEKLVLVLYGSGGSPIAAYRLVNLLRSFTRHLIIVVPDKALSAMTMVALGADEIYVGPLSVFSPIDTSIANHPLAPVDSKGHPVTVEITQVKKYLELVNSSRYDNVDDFRKSPYCELSQKVHPVFLGTIQRSLSLSRLLMRGILTRHISDASMIERLVNNLNDDFPSHAYPILKDDLSSMGIEIRNMTGEQTAMCMDLMGYLDFTCRWGQKVEGDSKSLWREYAIMESLDFRAYNYFTAQERLVDKNWVRAQSNWTYEHATIVKNKRGYYEVRALNANQFRKWMNGEEVEMPSSS